MRRWLLYVLLAIAGATQAISLAWPLDEALRGQANGVLQILSLAILAACIDRDASAGQALRHTFIFSTAWLLGSFWWLYISLHEYGGLPSPLAAAAVVLLAAALSMIYAGCIWAYRRSVAYGAPPIARVAGFAAAWTLAEWIRGNIATGFPWGAIGYAHVDSVLRLWAPWVGVYGLCVIGAALAATIGLRHVDNLKTGRPTRMVLAALSVAAVVMAWHSPARQVDENMTVIDRDSAAGIRIALLQGNVPQDLKFGSQAQQAMLDYQADMLSISADLIVTPETAFPYLPEQIPPQFWQPLRERKDRAFLMGMPLRAATPRTSAAFTNSVLGYANGHAADFRYDKHHLVPFGEFVPPFFQWFVDRMHIPLGDFATGALPQAPFAWKGERISVNICFEDLFGEELAQSFASPDAAPTLLLNVSNLAWFGNTVALDQHLNIARMRAMELARPMLRATNTGATALVNAQGQVIEKLPYNTRAALVVNVRGVQGEPTPYVQWVARWGTWPLLLFVLALWGIAAQMSRNSRHGQRRFAS